MMKQKVILCLCLALMIPTGISARKKIIKTKKPVVVEDPRFTAMLTSTAQITIIDSTVVDSLKFMSAIHVNKEEGQITSYQEFFHERGTGMVYINELGNKCIYSKYDGELGGKYLFQSDLLSDGWTIGEPLKGIDDNGQLHDFDFPYLMPDGVTLYFSAKGENGLGGYDIYRTRLDIDEGKFLKPENLGLPFNSPADDYCYVIDEQNRLAYFVTNRRQPAGKTCVYCFIPFDTRQVINNVDEDQVRSLARIDHIADTWGDKQEVTAARQRKATLTTNMSKFVSKKDVKDSSFEFVINDHTVYNNISQFKTAENRQRIQNLISMKKQAEDVAFFLQKSRDYYATASIHERAQLKSEIQECEQQLEALYAEIRTLEKTIRNTENQ